MFCIFLSYQLCKIFSYQIAIYDNQKLQHKRKSIVSSFLSFHRIWKCLFFFLCLLLSHFSLGIEKQKYPNQHLLTYEFLFFLNLNTLRVIMIISRIVWVQITSAFRKAVVLYSPVCVHRSSKFNWYGLAAKMFIHFLALVVWNDAFCNMLAT